MDAQRQEPRTVAGFAGAVAVLGLVLSLGLAWLFAEAVPPVTVSLLLVALALVAIWVPLRFERHGQTQGFTLEEAVFVAALFLVGPGWAPVLLVTAAVAGYFLKIRNAVKVSFNVGQVALWSSAAALAFYWVGPSDEVLAVRSVAAAVVAVLVANLVSLVALAELFRRLLEKPYAETFAEVWRLNGVTAVGNTTSGLLLALVAAVNPWALTLASVLLAGLYLGYRGYAHMLEDRHRQIRLHEMTQALATVPSSGELREFLLALRDLFKAGRSGLLLAGRGATWLEGETTRAGLPRGDDPLVVSSERGNTHRGSSDGTEAMAAPVIFEGATLGAIAVYGRVGLEPWDDNDETLLSTIAHEAAVALKNVELFQQVERERARWEAESTKLGDIVNAASDGIAMFSSDGIIQTWNDAMFAVTGLSAAQAIGQPWFIVLRLKSGDGTELLPDADHAINRAIDGQRYAEPIDLQVLRRDGMWRYLRATFAPIHREDTHPAGTVMVARDVTADREVESLKADFIATVSHELRTPLTPLRGFLQTLVAHRDMLNEDQMETIYGSMDKQLGRLERLISDLLVVADLDAGTTELRLENVDLLETATVAVAHEASSDTDRVVVHGREDVLVRGDGKAVARIVRALVSNALKHTDGPVEVLIEQDGDVGCLLVIDDGPGIAPWEQAEIFKRFRRLGDHLTRNQGPGLGLPIAAALAERLGGKVTVESDVGEGSTFALRLPLARPRLVKGEDTSSRASQVS